MRDKKTDTCPNCKLVLTTLAESLLAAGLTPAALGLPACRANGSGPCDCLRQP